MNKCSWWYMLKADDLIILKIQKLCCLGKVGQHSPSRKVRLHYHKRQVTGVTLAVKKGYWATLAAKGYWATLAVKKGYWATLAA